MKRLLLTGDNISLYSKNNIDDLTISNVYNNDMSIILLKVLRHSLFVEKTLLSWKDNIKQFDEIIIFDSVSTYSLLKWIQKIIPNTRKILYYRNSIATRKEWQYPSEMKKLGYETWTYNLSDSKKYRINYNSQFLNKNLFKEKNKIQEQLPIDVLFLGNKKGREKTIRAIYEKLTQKGLNCFFYVPDLPEWQHNECKDGKYLNYVEYINIIYKTKAILDIVGKDNYGLTLRPIEALFSEKKLLTTYHEITEYDFYKPNNILVIDDKNDFENIESFINSSYTDVSINIVNNYTFNNWIKRFEKV